MMAPIALLLAGALFLVVATSWGRAVDHGREGSMASLTILDITPDEVGLLVGVLMGDDLAQLDDLDVDAWSFRLDSDEQVGAE